jgi:hypothetical protein
MKDKQKPLKICELKIPSILNYHTFTFNRFSIIKSAAKQPLFSKKANSLKNPKKDRIITEQSPINMTKLDYTQLNKK